MDISIIIIEYNSVTDVQKCISSLRSCCENELEFEIIVSSNSCYPNEKRIALQKEFPDVRWIFNEKNGGFSYGMNRGLEAARGDFLLISNPDVRFDTSLKPAIKYLKEHPEAGALGAQIFDGQHQLQDSCRKFMWPFGMITRQFIRFFTGKDVILSSAFDYTRTQQVDWVIGAFTILKREVYEKVGGFDENFFLYVEDMDLHFRIRQAGYRTIYCPKVKITYKGDRKSTAPHISFHKFYNRYVWYHIKSYAHFLHKHYCPFRKY